MLSELADLSSVLTLVFCFRINRLVTGLGFDKRAEKMKFKMKQILEEISKSQTILDSKYFQEVSREADEIQSNEIGNAISKRNKELEQHGVYAPVKRTQE